MTYAIIDGNCLVSICFHAARAYGYSGNIIDDFNRFFWKRIQTLESKFPPHNVEWIVAWDSAGALDWRREIDPNYKQGRKKDPDIYEAINKAKEAFISLGYKAISLPETEADDLIYAAAKVLKTPINTVSIITRDRDLIQAVQDGYADNVYDPVKKDYLDIPEYNLVEYKCLVGDKSDAITGVAGIGPSRAKKMLEEGFDRNIITEQMKVVSIPHNPKHSEIIQHVQSVLL